jgi:hypothetical protein
MSEVICPWCGETNSDFDELFIHGSDFVDTECSSCEKNITIVQRIVIDYEISRTGHNDEGAEEYKFDKHCGNCYKEIEKNKPFYRCAICGNAVCVSCREQIKTRYPECYANMSLVTPLSTQEDKKG